MKKNIEIGKKIKDLRKSQKMSQDELAKKIGYLSRSSINKIENAERKLPADKIDLVAEIFKVSPSYLMGWDAETENSMRIPILGFVSAGHPIDAQENKKGYITIDESMGTKGEYYALKIKGDSMFPRIHNGDTIIFRKQRDIENGEIAIVSVGLDEATCKKVMKSEHGITLIALNQNVYEPKFYSNREIEDLPITIYGLVVEVRGKL